jgi:hypothetical protein
MHPSPFIHKSVLPLCVGLHCCGSCFPSIAADDAAEAAEVAAGGGAAKVAAKPKKKDDSMAMLAEGLAATKVTKPKK